MTARTMIERLRRHTGARNSHQLSLITGLDKGEISRIENDQRKQGMKLYTLLEISKNTGVPIGMLAEWWAEPEPC